LKYFFFKKKNYYQLVTMLVLCLVFMYVSVIHIYHFCVVVVTKFWGVS
jgi:hypothetical protein